MKFTLRLAFIVVLIGAIQQMQCGEFPSNLPSGPLEAQGFHSIVLIDASRGERARIAQSLVGQRVINTKAYPAYEPPLGEDDFGTVDQ